jgi:hypothetical protein
MIKYDYEHEKFSQAITTLAVNDASLSERLSYAFVRIRALDEKNIPEEIRDDFRELKESSVAEMTRDELYQTANKIVDIAGKIEYLYYQSVCVSVWRKPTED